MRVELPDGIVIDIAKDGSILSFEIFHASKIFVGYKKKVLQQAKFLRVKSIAERYGP